jgi:dethiobiotin synthetase
MSKKTFFVTGTDTDVGKTQIAVGLLHLANSQGLSTIGLKPVAAGCEKTEQGLRNQDALLLQAVSSVKLPYEQINPVALIDPVSPHIAAQQEKRVLSADRLAGFCRGSFRMADFTLVEGAGGWRVPINPSETMADLVQALQTPVILVVGMRLGCLNHALLTVEAIRQDGLPMVAWVANCLDVNMRATDENIQTLQQRIPAPCLGVVPFMNQPTPEKFAEYLSLSGLM